MVKRDTLEWEVIVGLATIVIRYHGFVLIARVKCDGLLLLVLCILYYSSDDAR